MKILITGASGRVAKYVIEDQERDHELLLVSRRYPSEGPNGARTDAPFVHANLICPDECQRVVAEVDAVAHIGAIGHPTDDTFRNNTLSTYYLAEAMRQEGVRLMIFALSNCALRLGWCWGEQLLACRRAEPSDPVRHMDGFWCLVEMCDAAQAFRKALEQPLPETPHYFGYEPQYCRRE